MAESLTQAIRAALLTPEPDAKVAAAQALADGWFDLPGHPVVAMPDRPGRPARPVLLPARDMPRRDRGGSTAPIALLHAVAHIEFNAIDLALDVAGRFGPSMPETFTADWLRVAGEEAGHFRMLQQLLARTGNRYGDMPAHDGLWQAAMATAHDLPARLAVVPQVLEARGLDVTPAMIMRFAEAGDAAAAAVLGRILQDEVGHVAVGNKWFRHCCADSRTGAAEAFRRLVKTHFRGSVKPPFNDSARLQAGLTPDWYSALGTDVNPLKP